MTVPAKAAASIAVALTSAGAAVTAAYAATSPTPITGQPGPPGYGPSGPPGYKTDTGYGFRIVKVQLVSAPPRGAIDNPVMHPTSKNLSQFTSNQLSQLVVFRQSAKVHTISGATYTSKAYLKSLQGAITNARHFPKRTKVFGPTISVHMGAGSFVGQTPAWRFGLVQVVITVKRVVSATPSPTPTYSPITTYSPPTPPPSSPPPTATASSSLPPTPSSTPSDSPSPTPSPSPSPSDSPSPSASATP